jgi:pyruvate kinase
MRTKIVCTIGPSSESEDALRAIVRAGMDVARLNFSHGGHDDHARRLHAVRKVADEEKALVTVMGDLQGPKFRIGKMPDEGVLLERDQTVVISDHASEDEIPFPHADVLMAIQPGQKLLIDDGALILLVTRKVDETSAACTVIAGGKLTSRKGVSAPGVKIVTSSITEKDQADLEFAVKHGVDAVALSFVRSAQDVRELRQRVKELGGNQLIVAKLEKPEAMDDLPNIIRESDAVMVARGDLGVEAAPEEVPFYQKRIILSCLRAGKPVITATQMLQSMIEAPSPTRAEASDVANAVLDGTDAVMLSGETAMGAYPVAAVEAMARIAKRAEESAIFRTGPLAQEVLDLVADDGDADAEHKTDAITTAAVHVAETCGVKAIVCATASGYTARMIARHRPVAPVVCISPYERTLKYSAFMWGVRGVVAETRSGGADELFEAAAKMAASMGMAAPGDSIVVTAGLPLGGGAGHSNVIKVQVVK